MKDFDFCFNSMPIDEYYDFRYGHLPYRLLNLFIALKRKIYLAGML